MLAEHTYFELFFLSEGKCEAYGADRERANGLIALSPALL